MSSGGKRALAVVAVVAMIGVAVVVRGASAGGGGGPESGKPRLLCASELGAACDALASRDDIEVDIVPGMTSVDSLSKVADTKAAGYDGWLAPSMLPKIVEDNRTASSVDPLFGRSSTPIGRSPLVLLMWDERYQKMKAHCPEQKVDWKCLGSAAPLQWSSIGGDPAWGSVDLAHPNAATDAAGLAVLGQEVSSYFTRSNLHSNDFDDDDTGFIDWFTALEDNVARSGDGSVDSMLRDGLAGVDALGTVEAGACQALRANTRGKVDVVLPKPVASVDVVYTPLEGRTRGGELGDIVRDAGGPALAGSGWRVQGQKTAGRQCAGGNLDPSDNLPDPGTLADLLTRSGHG